VLEHPRPHARFDVLARARLEDDGLDAREAQEPPEQQPGRPGADDPDLRSNIQIMRLGRRVDSRQGESAEIALKLGRR
jgi:hypothetical protein